MTIDQIARCIVDSRFWFDLALDIFFIVDLFLSFKTAVLTDGGDLLWRKKDVANNYFRGW
jgi:hypothetical protein